MTGNKFHKKFSDILKRDIQRHAVWEFDDEREHVFPIVSLPVCSLEGRFVGTKLTLANGSHAWAMMYLLDLGNPFKNLHFRMVLIDTDSGWFELARYFDAHYGTNSPKDLCLKLDLELDEVFPIIYDLSEVACGNPEVVKGSIGAFVEEPLSLDEIIDLTS